MTPLQFEQLYEAQWQELEKALKQRPGLRRTRQGPSAARIAWLYRRACEQLALARERSYPAYLTERLEQMTAEAHQLIYRDAQLGTSRLVRFVAKDFPRAVRAQSTYVWVALAVFAVPLLVLGVLVYWHPALVLTMVSAREVDSFEEMYSDGARVLGPQRDATTDWTAFGYYIRHNITVSFQCFASGLFAGVGTLFYLLLNGALIGAIGGYLTERGHAANFYSFVVTHSAFELTAIVLSGAAGLKLGAALILPGRRTRLDALMRAAGECVPIMYGVMGMLTIAAALEAFWSSATWQPLPLKYGMALVGWTAVLAYFWRQGRTRQGS